MHSIRTSPADAAVMVRTGGKKVLESLKFKTCYFRALKIVEMCRSPGKPHKSPGISVFAGS